MYLTLALVADSHTIDTGAVVVAATADVARNTSPTQVADTLILRRSTTVAKLTSVVATAILKKKESNKCQQ